MSLIGEDEVCRKRTKITIEILKKMAQHLRMPYSNISKEALCRSIFVRMNRNTQLAAINNAGGIVSTAVTMAPQQQPPQTPATASIPVDTTNAFRKNIHTFPRIANIIFGNFANQLIRTELQATREELETNEVGDRQPIWTSAAELVNDVSFHS